MKIRLTILAALIAHTLLTSWVPAGMQNFSNTNEESFVIKNSIDNSIVGVWKLVKVNIYDKGKDNIVDLDKKVDYSQSPFNNPNAKGFIENSKNSVYAFKKSGEYEIVTKGNKVTGKYKVEKSDKVSEKLILIDDEYKDKFEWKLIFQGENLILQLGGMKGNEPSYYQLIFSKMN